MKVSHRLRLATAAALVISPALALAQNPAGSVVVTPYVGVYSPSTDVMKEGVSAAGQSVTANGKHQASAAYGMNASYWITDRLGIELGGAYSSSQLKGTITQTGITPVTITDHAHIWLGSAKLMIQLLPPSTGANLRLGIGPAFVTRGGTAYSGDNTGSVTGLTDFGGAVSLCSKIPVTRNFGIRVRAEDYMYQAKLGWNAVNANNSYTFNSRMQHDFVFSAGLQFMLNP
ncbi:MAG TPA: hypothetical protein VHB25_03160 [Gemmatimonadaceae bacterium]|nr:hypothetical protein [Gemmatimonadaceae bacterium]